MKIVDKFTRSFLTFFGDIKVFKFPFFIVYDPGSYLVKGEDIRNVINTIQPGDIVLRGYKNYLDGYFIPGFFSHAGLYVGKVVDSDKQFVKEGEEKEFKTGEQMVVHSMAEGVFMEDIINFCRCDYMIILRRNPSIESEAAKAYTFAKVFETALQNLGKGYDFKFDFVDFTNLSCTEFVYASCLCIMEDYDIKIREKRVLGIKKRIIDPDDFVRSKLDIIFKPNSVTDKHIAKIKKI